MRKNTAFLALCRVNLTHLALYSGRKEAPAWIKSGSERFSRDTAIAMAEYSQVTAKSSRWKVIGILFITFGLFIIISALSIFPSESSWGSIYATLGSIILIAGIYLIIRQLVAKRAVRLSLVFGCAVLLFGAFTLSDYIAVTQFHQVPRFSYETVYDSRLPDQLVHKTLFFTAIQQNPGTPQERIYIAK